MLCHVSVLLWPDLPCHCTDSRRRSKQEIKLSPAQEKRKTNTFPHLFFKKKKSSCCCWSFLQLSKKGQHNRHISHLQRGCRCASWCSQPPNDNICHLTTVADAMCCSPAVTTWIRYRKCFFFCSRHQSHKVLPYKFSCSDKVVPDDHLRRLSCCFNYVFTAASETQFHAQAHNSNLDWQVMDSWKPWLWPKKIRALISSNASTPDSFIEQPAKWWQIPSPGTFRSSTASSADLRLNAIILVSLSHTDWKSGKSCWNLRSLFLSRNEQDVTLSIVT